MKKRATKFEPGRITMLRELLQMSQVKFANKIRISQGALSQIENGKSQISFDTLHNLSTELNVNCNWVVNGVGKIFDKAVGGEILSHTQKNTSFYTRLKDHAFLPLVKAEEQEEYIKNYDDQDYVKTLETFKIPGYENGKFRLFEIAEENMIPTIYPCEIVICRYLDESEALKNGSPCVLITKDGLTVSRIYNEKNKDLFSCKNDNRQFRSYTLNANAILEKWEVTGKITSVFIGTDHVMRMEKLENDLKVLKKEVKNLTTTKSSY